jgi:hypothetical protein
MLFAFWEKDKSKGGKLQALQALMFLGGEHKEGGLRFMIVPEEEAEAAAANFSALSSRHIYSLQRTLPKAGYSSCFSMRGRRASTEKSARGEPDAVDTPVSRALLHPLQDPSATLYAADYDIVKSSLASTAS